MNTQEDKACCIGRPAHYSDLHCDSSQCCPYDLTHKLIVARTFSHRTVQTKGTSFEFHTQTVLTIHHEPFLYLHLSVSEKLCAMAYDIRRGALQVFCVLSCNHWTKPGRITECCIDCPGVGLQHMHTGICIIHTSSL